MIVMLMSLNVGAQEMEDFERSYGYMVTNVVNGEKERCWYTTKVEPYSQIDLAGISVGTLVVPSDTVNNLYYVGGNKKHVAIGDFIKLEKGRYLTELETMDLGKYGSISTLEWPLSFHNNTQIYSDPDVSLYDYSTFDFEFTENNVIQQKEISGIIEKELNKKNLKRDRETPDILIYINYYSDKRENYTPPTQEIVTRYKYGYEIGSGWGTRQYVESQTKSGYTQAQYLLKFTITMLDADKVRNGSKVTPIIWNADFEASGLSSVPALKPFCDDAVNFMFCQFPIVHYTGDKLIFKKTYLCPIGLLFEKKKTKRIYHVLKDSPAEKVGIGIGDEFVKYVGDIVWNSDTGNTTFDMLIKRKNGKKEIIHFEEIKSYEVVETHESTKKK